MYNQVGDRIFYVGGNDVPPVFEHSRPLLDFQVSKKIISNRGELKLDVADIFNKASDYYYDNNKNNNYDKDTDVLTIKKKYGTNVSLTFSYNIK